MRFEFLTIDNQAEYEVIIACLTLESEMGVERIKLKTDSQLVVSKIKGESQTKNPALQHYVWLARENLTKFKMSKI